MIEDYARPPRPEIYDNPSNKFKWDVSGRKPGPPPAWLDIQYFRTVMFSYINRVCDGRWQAVSSNNGLIWFRYDALKDILCESSQENPAVMALAVDVRAMDDLVFTTLKSLGDCVYWDLLGKGYNRTKCNIIDRKGIITETTYLTPVRPLWFGFLPGWLDRQKTDKLRQTVASVEIVYGRNK